MRLPVTPADVHAAVPRLNGAIVVTPTVAAKQLSRRFGAEIFLKLENLQVTGSFKPRGALNRLLAMTAAQRKTGIIAMSAGNHAQGVAYHAQRLAIPATIVMPRATPYTKVARTTQYGTRVVLEGDDLSAAAAHAHDLARAEGLTFIHPYDDRLIIAGQGTVGSELLSQAPPLDVVLVPIGGGGLCAGMVVALRSIDPRIEIIGVQAAQFPHMAARLRGEASSTGHAGTLAEGIAVKAPGALTAEILGAAKIEILLVSEAEIEHSVGLILTEEKLLAEGAGATPVAALLANPDRFKGRRLGLVISGGNIDPRMVASILLRGLVAEGRMARLRVAISDQPGWLARVAKVIGDAGGNIIEIYHHRLFPDVPVTRTELDVVVETRGPAHVVEIIGRLEQDGLSVRRLDIATTSPDAAE